MKTHKINIPRRQESPNPAREIKFKNHLRLINIKGKEEKQIVGARGLSTAFLLKDTLAMQGRVANQRLWTTNEVEEAWFQVSYKIPGCVPNTLLGVEACTYTCTGPHIYVHTHAVFVTHSHSVAPH